MNMRGIVCTTWQRHLQQTYFLPYSALISVQITGASSSMLNSLPRRYTSQPTLCAHWRISTVPLPLEKRKAGRSIIIGTPPPDPDPKLSKALAHVVTRMDLLKSGKTLSEIVAQAQTRPEHIRKYLKLATLSPKIQSAILAGHPSLTWQLTDFIRATDLPLVWRAQDARILQASANP